MPRLSPYIPIPILILGWLLVCIDSKPLVPKASIHLYSSQLNNLLVRVAAATTAALPLIYSSPAAAADSRSFTLKGPYAPILKIPLERFDGHYTLNFTVNNARQSYRAIVDSGSPFLMVPSVCSRDWGCVNSEYSPAEGLGPTTESFGGQEYDTDWVTGNVRFVSSTALASSAPVPVDPQQLFASASTTASSESARITFRDVIFGSVGEDVLRRPGGVFVGLVKYRAKEIRPTLLGQIGYSALRFDAPGQLLTLSKQPLIPPEENAIKIFDLRTLGSPIMHYACRVKRLYVNEKQINTKEIYAIFDTGTSGCVLSDDIMLNDDTPIPPRKVTVVVETENGEERTLEAGAMPLPRVARGAGGGARKSTAPSPSSRQKKSTRSIFVVSSAKVPWKAFLSPARTHKLGAQSERDKDIERQRRLKVFPQLVVLGLAFLEHSVLTVDIDRGRLTLASVSASVSGLELEQKSV